MYGGTNHRFAGGHPSIIRTARDSTMATAPQIPPRLRKLLGAGTLTLLGAAPSAAGCAVDASSQSWDATDTGVDLASCPGGAPHLVDGRPATWTLLHYAAADNNLEEVIVNDLDEMELGHQGSRNVNVIVQLDRRSEPGRWRYRVEPDREAGTIGSTVVEFSEEEPNTGDWRTLSEFGRWGVTCYPAENYVLVIGGHGGGWSSSRDRSLSMAERGRHFRARRTSESLRTIAPDDSDHSEIYVDQLARALGEVRRATQRPEDPAYLNRLVLYGSDACLMETTEVAYELRNAVTYLIGSEQTEPAEGWPYNTLVRELTSRPSYYAVRPHLLAAMMVEVYGRSFGPGGGAPDSDRVTLAAVDTSAMIRARNRIDRIAELLSQLLDVDAELLPILLEAREQSFDFGDDYADLGRFVDNLRTALATAGKIPAPGQVWHDDERWRTLREQMNELMDDVFPDLVVANVAGSYDGARGLSVFFPTDSCGWGMDLDEYQRAPFAEDTAWGRFLKKLVDVRGSGDFRSARGEGTMDYQAWGQDFSATVRCSLDDGALNVRISDWNQPCPADDEECIDRLDLNFELDVLSQTVTGAHLWCGAKDVSADIEEAAIPVTPAEGQWISGETYEASFELSFEPATGESVAPIPVNVHFRCEAFEAQECWGHW